MNLENNNGNIDINVLAERQCLDTFDQIVENKKWQRRTLKAQRFLDISY